MAQHLTAQQQQEMEARFQRKQLQDFVGLYNRLSNRCFNSCCNDFTSRKLSPEQTECVNLCVGKFFQASQRIGQRFQESQVVQQLQGEQQ